MLEVGSWKMWKIKLCSVSRSPWPRPHTANPTCSANYCRQVSTCDNTSTDLLSLWKMWRLTWLSLLFLRGGRPGKLRKGVRSCPDPCSRLRSITHEPLRSGHAHSYFNTCTGKRWTFTYWTLSWFNTVLCLVCVDSSALNLLFCGSSMSIAWMIFWKKWCHGKKNNKWSHTICCIQTMKVCL